MARTIRESSVSRRHVLGLGVGLFAGCAGTGGETTSTPTDTASPDASSAALALREANVVGVSVDRDGGAARFKVTVHHDDEGEEGYANWWQVERLDGTRLGRRDLAHPHAEQPFTRAADVDIPAEVTCVVVRGHDRTHGYGGQAALVDLSSGETRFVRQGDDERSFTDADCPEP